MTVFVGKLSWRLNTVQRFHFSDGLAVVATNTEAGRGGRRAQRG